ncbi:MAG: cytidylate kinase-like family protein [Lachnospiraceae bacterium]|nr:cytidylate kinase-like family protein [Lachnospiraceae bacterium]
MIKIITISREFGSGGRTIGKEVAEKLGIPCYDKDLIEKIAEETGYAKNYIADESEYAPNSNSLAYMFIGRGLDGLSNADKIWIAQKKVIEELAEKRLADKDKKRKLNYKYFTEQEWGRRQNYHLSIDSGFLGIEKSVALIVDAVGGAVEHE